METNNPSPDIPVPNEPTTIELNKSNAAIICIAALLTAALYSLCFTGAKVYPSLSFTIFCNAAILFFYAVTKQLGIIKNKKGFLWALPIVLLSLFNGIFQLSPFSYFNVIAVHYLFAVMSLKVTRDKGCDVVNFFISAIGCILNNIFKSSDIFGKFTNKKTGGGKSTVKIIATCCLSLPVLLFVGLLLTSADQVFSHYVSSFFYGLTAYGSTYVTHVIVILLVCIYIIGYIRNLLRDRAYPNIKLSVNGDNIVICTFLTLLNLLFATFCIIQLLFLFSGGFMKLPEGIVYSEYARSGFFQLLFVTVINFSVLILLIEVFNASLQYRPVKVLLLFLCLFTGVLIYSSFYRMNLYMQAYNYTELRLMVTSFLVMESVLIIVTAAYLVKRGALPFMRADRSYCLIRAYAHIGLIFFIAANFTCTRYLADKLNVREYYASQSARNPDINYSSEKLDCYYFSIDGITALIDIYNDPQTTDIILKKHIKDRIFDLYCSYSPEPVVDTYGWAADNSRQNYIYSESADGRFNQTIIYPRYINTWQNYSYFKNKNYKAVVKFIEEN